MQCLYPVRIPNPKPTLRPMETAYIDVPCGKCIACRINKTRDWQSRLLMESFYWQDLSFITLTYNPENLPDDFSIHKRDLQLFFKRLRFNLDGRKIKYFASGEYGDMFGRPHYHAILFGIHPIKDRELVDDSWNKGFVHFGSVTNKSIRYCCKYVQKKINGVLSDKHYEGREKEFCLCSQGLGDEYLEEYHEKLILDGCFMFQGKRSPLPRRFKQRFMSEDEKYSMLLVNLERYANYPYIPVDVRERRLYNMLNRYTRPEYQVHLDRNWNLRE